jgi:tetratricopeptide (TPR) repeat protein
MTAPRIDDSLRTRAFTLAEAGAWADVCALLASQDGRTRERAELVTLFAEALLRTGRPREARAWVKETLGLITPRADRASMRRALNLLGAAHFELGELGEAQDAFERAVELAREDGDDLLVARATNNLGAIANIRGQHDTALALYQLTVPAYQRLGSPLGLAECYHNMAITFRDVGQLDRADEYERRAIDFAREAESARLVALARLGRAEVYLRKGDARLAEAGARRAARDFRDVPDPISEADALRLAGVACHALGKLADARAALDAALSLAREHGGALNEAETLRARAELAAATGDRGAARDDASAALEIFTRLNAEEERLTLARWLDSLASQR